MARVLALDVGTSSVRASLFDDAAECQAEPVRRDYGGELDPDRILGHVREVIDEAGGSDRVDAVGASCFGHSLLPLDAAGRPLTEILSWRDMRSAGAAARLARELDTVAVHGRTGCYVHTSYWPAKLAWLAEEKPDVFRVAARFVSFGDYVYEQLGRPVDLSMSLASATGLVDLRTGSWDAELVATLGLDLEQLPRISDEPAEGWYPASFDGACANLGVGCVTRECAVLMVGTSGALRVLYETAEPRPRSGLFLYRVDTRRIVEGGSLSDGGNLYAWLEQTLEPTDGSLRNRDPDSHGLTFLTLLGGERSPGWHQHMKGMIHGLTFETTPLDLRQAGLEGIAFRFAEVADLMPEVQQLVAAGGALLKDPDWVQIMADALGRPITTTRVEEASLRGAAVLTLERLGVEAPPAPLGDVVQPRPEKAESFRAARQRQRRLYEVATRSWTK